MLDVFSFCLSIFWRWTTVASLHFDLTAFVAVWMTLCVFKVVLRWCQPTAEELRQHLLSQGDTQTHWGARTDFSIQLETWRKDDVCAESDTTRLFPHSLLKVCVFSALIKNLEAGPGPIFSVHKCDVETSGLQCTNTGNEYRVDIK